MTSTLNDKLFSRDKVLNARKKTCLHQHPVHELYYLQHGETKYFVHNQIFLLKEGDLIFVPKQTLHSTDSENCLYNERLLLSFDEKHCIQEATPIIETLSTEKIIHIPEKHQPLIQEMFFKIENEYNLNKSYRNPLIKLYMSELLIYLYRYRSTERPIITDTDTVIKEVMNYIELNFDKELSLNLLCSRFSISKSHLSRLFKSVNGIGISEYINYVRISNAERLLKNENLSITKIAEQCGFNDSNYFSTVFKKLKGITPYKYSKT